MGKPLKVWRLDLGWKSVWECQYNPGPSQAFWCFRPRRLASTRKALLRDPLHFLLSESVRKKSRHSLGTL